MTPHSHPHLADFAKKNTGRLALSLSLTLLFVVVEAGAGWISNSLALLTDAAHNLTDVFALALSWFAMRLTIRPADSRRTFGYHRAGILAALINSSTLVLISLGIFYEAWRRFSEPPEIRTGILIGVGLLALIINLVTALLIKQGSQHDLNLRSAFVHLMGDVISTLGAVLAGIAIYFTGWNWLDPLVSVLIGIMILLSAAGILRETLSILLESAPHDVDMTSLVREIVQVPGVLGVHDLHVWSLSRGLRTMSAHLLTDDISISRGSAIQAEVSQLVAHRFNISHTTLQLECVLCDAHALNCGIDSLHLKR